MDGERVVASGFRAKHDFRVVVAASCAERLQEGYRGVWAYTEQRPRGLEVDFSCPEKELGLTVALGS